MKGLYVFSVRKFDHVLCGTTPCGHEAAHRGGVKSGRNLDRNPWAATTTSLDSASCDFEDDKV